MQKSQVRLLKTHYGSRWRSDHPSLHEKAVARMLVPGSCLTFDCVLQGIPNMIVDKPGRYNNVLALNLPAFKYKTLDQLLSKVTQLKQQTIPQGLIFVSFNFQFVNFNRFRKDFSTALDKWINDLQQLNIVCIKNLTRRLPNTNDWGDCFFVFKNYEISTDNLL